MATTILPSRNRVEPGSINIPLGKLPATATSTSENPTKVAATLIQQLNDALAIKDSSALKTLFIENSYWRDHLVVSWDFHTLKGPEAIASFVIDAELRFEIDDSSLLRAPHNGPIDAFGEVYGVEFFVKVFNGVGSDQGIVRLVQEGGEWRLFTVFTSLVEIKRGEEKTFQQHPAGVQHGELQGRKNWLDRRESAVGCQDTEPAVLVVGMYSRV